MARTKAVDEEMVEPDETVDWKGVTYDLKPYDEVRMWQGEGREVGKTFCKLLAHNDMDDALDIPVNDIGEAREFQAMCRVHTHKREWQ